MHIPQIELDLLGFFLEKVCVLVTLAFLLTRGGCLVRPAGRGLKFLIPTLLFLVLGFAEVVISKPNGVTGIDSAMNLRIVGAAAAGLIAGPWIGIVIGIAITVIAVWLSHQTTAPIAISMVVAGLVGGLIRNWKPEVASRPAIGFVVGVATSLLRDVLVIVTDKGKWDPAIVVVSSLVNGLSVALVLLVIEQARRQEAQARAVAVAELRALQARMNPHFLFNSLNTLSALSQVEPAAVPGAAASLGHFLRFSLDQHERPFVSLQEELEVVDAYLDIETLRMGERLHVRRSIDQRLLDAHVPPFLLQPLVENAVRHGLQNLSDGGTVHIGVSASEGQLVVTVIDTGLGVTPSELASMLVPQHGHAHALTLLNRRLEVMFGTNCLLSLTSEGGQGVKATVKIPLSGVLAQPEARVLPPTILDGMAPLGG